jgi:hypothetical protein
MQTSNSTGLADASRGAETGRGAKLLRNILESKGPGRNAPG